MELCGHGTQRYRARAARRPFLFWWQAFLLLGLVVFLWSQLPVSAVLYEARVFSPLPEPRAAYVTLEPSYAAQVFKKVQHSWGMGNGDVKPSFGMDLGLVELHEVIEPPSYLEQGGQYPGIWRPAAVEPLPQRLPDLGVSSVTEVFPARQRPDQAFGIRRVLAPPLAQAGFTFALPAGGLPERTGHCRYQVETDAGGAVVHVLLLTSPSESAAVLERALLRGKANGASRGDVDVYWSFSQ